MHSARTSNAGLVFRTTPSVQPDGSTKRNSFLVHQQHRYLLYVMQNGNSSSSPELHKLVRAANIIELQLGRQMEVVHVSGRIMIVQEQMTSAGACGLTLSASSGLCLMSPCSLWKQRLFLRLFPTDSCRWSAIILGRRTITIEVSQIGSGVLFSNNCPFGLHLQS